MNASELARLMLYWESQKRGLAKTEGRIKEAVLELGRTVDTGCVRASYSAGRKKYDYETAAKGVAPSTIRAFRVVREAVDWSGLCRDQEITDIPFTQGEPSVTVKLME